LFARSIDRLLMEPGLAPAHGTLLLAGTGDAQAVVILFGHAMSVLGRLVKGVPKLVNSQFGLVFYVLATAFLLSGWGNQRQSYGMLAAGSLALWYCLTRSSWWRNVVPLLFVFGLLAICLAKGRATRFVSTQVYQIKDLGTPVDDIASQA